MPREAMIWNNPTVTAALTEEGLDTAPALECQITSAMLTPQPQFNTIPSTGCAGATQSPGLTGWQVDLAWLQDWVKAPADSLSWFAWTNDGAPVWLRIVPDDTAASQVAMVGQFYAVAGGFGATFGDGSAAATTATWPALAKPDIAAVV